MGDYKWLSKLAARGRLHAVGTGSSADFTLARTVSGYHHLDVRVIFVIILHRAFLSVLVSAFLLRAGISDRTQDPVGSQNAGTPAERLINACLYRLHLPFLDRRRLAVTLLIRQRAAAEPQCACVSAALVRLEAMRALVEAACTGAGARSHNDLASRDSTSHE